MQTGDDPPPGSRRRDALLDEIHEMAFATGALFMRQHPDGSIDELNAVLGRQAAIHNRSPRPEFGGLSPDQVHMLLRDPWDGTGVIRLRSDLPLASFERSRLLRNARTMLAYLQENGRVKATATGNLTRAAVAALAERMDWEPGYLENLRAYSKIVNEEDLFPLHVTRVLLMLAGLMKRRKGSFSATRRGEEMLHESKAGELFALLFRTHFRVLNLEYLSRSGLDVPEVQETIAFTLHRLGKVATSWKTSSELAARIILPAVLEVFPSHTYMDWPSFVLSTQVLRPLEELGLLSVRVTPRRERIPEVRHYRRTPLFDGFLSFSFR